MAQLFIYPVNELPPLIRCQILSFMRVNSHEVFQRMPLGWDFLVSDTHPVSFVLIENETLLSHALVTQRQLDYAGSHYLTCGLGAVFTYPEVRGRGYGQRVAQAATDHILASDADIAMLRCQPALKKFYGPCGWIAVDELQIHYGDPNNPIAGDRIMMLFVSDKGQRDQSAFEHGPVYVGTYMW